MLNKISCVRACVCLRDSPCETLCLLAVASPCVLQLPSVILGLQQLPASSQKQGGWQWGSLTRIKNRWTQFDQLVKTHLLPKARALHTFTHTRTRVKITYWRLCRKDNYWGRKFWLFYSSVLRTKLSNTGLRRLTFSALYCVTALTSPLKLNVLLIRYIQIPSMT